MRARTGAGGVADLDDIAAAAVRTVAVGAAQAYGARDAFARFGKGQAPAGLNYGDCFSYALARSMGQTLLFKGDDFAQTDVKPAAN